MAKAVLDEMDVSGAAEPHYRTMSGGAVAGLVLGFLSVITLGAAANSLQACLVVSFVPIIGMIVSGRALLEIRRMPEDYTGGGLARAGLVLSAVFLVAGVASGAYRYATEVPPGYERVDFLAMKPDAIEERGGVLVPENIRTLDGQKVFITGYMRPPAQRSNLSKFLLVRDNQQCCFGPLAEVSYFDQVRVELEPPLLAEYSTGRYGVGGLLKILDNGAAGSAPVYMLVADHLQQ